MVFPSLFVVSPIPILHACTYCTYIGRGGSGKQLTVEDTLSPCTVIHWLFFLLDLRGMRGRLLKTMENMSAPQTSPTQPKIYTGTVGSFPENGPQTIEFRISIPVCTYIASSPLPFYVSTLMMCTVHTLIEYNMLCTFVPRSTRQNDVFYSTSFGICKWKKWK